MKVYVIMKASNMDLPYTKNFIVSIWSSMEAAELELDRILDDIGEESYLKGNYSLAVEGWEVGR